MRTVAVVLVGIFLSIFGAALLDHLIDPHAQELIVKAFTLPRDSPQWAELSLRLQRSAWLTSYVVNPLTGFLIGIFVGIFQKRHTVVVAAGCLIPYFLYTLLMDRGRLFSHSVNGLLTHLFVVSLPFMAAVVTATAIQHLMTTDHHVKGAGASAGQLPTA